MSHPRGRSPRHPHAGRHLRPGRSRTAAGAGAGELNPEDRDPRTFIPHRPPILCIDTVLGVDHQAATADWLIPDAATVASELWEPWLVEGLAQTAGVLNGMNERTTGGTSRKGMLVGVRRLRFHRRPTVGETVRFHVELVKRLGPLTLIDGRVTVGDDLVAAGEMKFYVEVE